MLFKFASKLSHRKNNQTGGLMNHLKFIHDYKDQTEYRLSFNRLANLVFGIDFEKWYQQGSWNDRYICYSYVDGNNIIANLSINILGIVLNGHSYSAIQIGTVMTHPDYRNKGLSRKLMEIVLADYESKCDFMYLFANKSVLNFYTKFGFKQIQESRFTINVSIKKSHSNNIRKLDVTIKEDWDILIKMASERKTISKICGAISAIHILTWYGLNVFYNDIYFIEDKNIIVIYQKENKEIHLFDVISNNETCLSDFINTIADEEINKVHFHFTPDFKDIIPTKSSIDKVDTLFIKSVSVKIPSGIKFPIIAQA